MDEEFYQDEFYDECPECREKLMKASSYTVYCPECGYLGDA